MSLLLVQDTKSGGGEKTGKSLINKSNCCELKFTHNKEFSRVGVLMDAVGKKSLLKLPKSFTVCCEDAGSSWESFTKSVKALKSLFSL